MTYPEYVEVGGTRYKINTDFRIAIKCDQIARDTTIGDFERTLGILCTLFGEKSIDNPEHYDKLFELAIKYLTCGKGIDETQRGQEPDMDYVEDMDYIEASFMSDYHIDLSNTKMHWWKFSKLINGLSNSEIGNCCILNRIRNLRNYDTSGIKDTREKSKIEHAKKMVALSRNRKENYLTDEQEKSMQRLNEIVFGKEN